MSQMRAPLAGDSFSSNVTGQSYVGGGQAIYEINPQDMAEALARGWLPSGPGLLTNSNASGNIEADTFELANAAAGVITRTLPPANSAQWAFIKKVDASANAVNVAPNGTDTIDGANAAQAITTPKAVLRLYSDGVSAWYIA